MLERQSHSHRYMDLPVAPLCHIDSTRLLRMEQLSRGQLLGGGQVCDMTAATGLNEKSECSQDRNPVRFECCYRNSGSKVHFKKQECSVGHCRQKVMTEGRIGDSGGGGKTIRGKVMTRIQPWGKTLNVHAVCPMPAQWA